MNCNTTHYRANSSSVPGDPTIHFYGDRADQELAEDADIGSGFPSEVVRAWEAAAEPARQAGIRVVHARLGMVLTPAGGVIPAMLPTFRLGLGTILGRGTQWWSWVSLHDALSGLLFVLAHDDLRGPVNITAPVPVTAAEFAATLSKSLDRPLFMRVPGWALRLGLGEKSSVLTMSTRAVPDKLRRAGFKFRYPALDEALKHELATAPRA